MRTRIIGSLGCLAVALAGISWWHGDGKARLISIEEYPADGDSCYLPAKADNQSLFAEFESRSVHAQEASPIKTIDVTRPPARDIRDTAPIYSSVSVDAQRNEVYLQDSNTWSIRVFSRSDNAQPGQPPTEARRVITGPKTDIQFNSC